MAQDQSELVVGQNGNIYTAAADTAGPTATTGSWPGGWTDLGLVNSDGVTFTQSKNIEDINSWQLFFPARRIVTGVTATLACTLQQWNADTLAFALSGSFTGAVLTPADPEDIVETAFGVEWRDGNKVFRLFSLRGTLTGDTAIQVARNAAAELPITYSVSGVANQDPWTLVADFTS